MVRNDRLVAVARMSRVYEDVHTLSDLKENFAWDVEEFFQTYNRMIERPFEIIGRGEREEAESLLEKALQD